MAGLLEWQTTRPVQPQLASGVCKNNSKQRRLAIGLDKFLLTFLLLLGVAVEVGALLMEVAVELVDIERRPALRVVVRVLNLH
jgi:hypothetical protein